MKKNIEQTLAIIKPDGMKNSNEILKMIYDKGLTVDKFKAGYLTKKVLKEHYAHLLDKPFYPQLEEYMLSGEVAILVLEGENAVEKFRNLMGPTDSTKAEPGTIRGKFGKDITHNAIHGSDSKENAEIEINRFFNTNKKVLVSKKEEINKAYYNYVKEKEFEEKLGHFKTIFGDEFVLNAYESQILNFNNIALSYWFAKNIEGANLLAHANIVINGDNPFVCNEFALNVPNLSNSVLFRLCDVIMKDETDEIAYYNKLMNIKKIREEKFENKNKTKKLI